MRKYYTIPADPSTSLPRRSRVPALLLLIVLAALSPWLYEEGMVVHSQWRTLMGTYTVARTPRLDSLREWYRSSDQSMRSGLSSLFHGGEWNPALTVPIGIAWAGVMAAVFLRKVR